MGWSKKGPRLGFFGWLTIWVLGLLLLNSAHQVAAGFLRGWIWKPSEVLFQLPGWIGLYLPFATFAGGVTAQRELSEISVMKHGVLVALLSYCFLAFGSPNALYWDHSSSGADVSVEFPFGPRTPHGLLAQRAAIESDPPETYSFRAERPLERPPNWLTYLLHSTIVIAAFSIVAGLLGHRSGKLTTGLSPPNRRNARWALGLAISIAFFLAEAAGGDWVRADPSNGGAWGAWLPLVVPMMALGFLEVLLRSRANNQSTSAGL